MKCQQKAESHSIEKNYLKKMRICIIGHSLIADRQRLFCEAIRKLGHEVLEIYSSQWHILKREGGYKIKNEGNFKDYYFDVEAFLKIKKFMPNLIYSMTEWYQQQAFVSDNWAQQLDIPLVLFCWENIKNPNFPEQELIKRCKLIVCGNSDAEKIVKPYNKNTIRLTQVGIDTDLFKHKDNYIKMDLGFVGRNVEEKGIKYVEKLSKEFKLIKAEGIDYLSMPDFYNQIKILIVPSLDVPIWREQWPSAIAEALACGTSVIAFDAGNIKEHYGKCKVVRIIEQGNLENMKGVIESWLNLDIGRKESGKDGRKFVLKNFSNQIVAKKLIEALEKIK